MLRGRLRLHYNTPPPHCTALPYILESFTADIWIVYLQYLQKHKSGTADGREALEEAFKVHSYSHINFLQIALKSVGTDVRSGPIWKSYLVFLNTADADNPRMESIKNSFIRKTYQKAISIPHNAVEEIWRDYDLFENKQDPTLVCCLKLALTFRHGG